MYSITNVTNFFDKNLEFKKYDFLALDVIYQNTSSEFIKESVIQTLYSYISDSKILFSTILSNKDVTSFLNNYELSNKNYKKYEDETLKIKKFLVGDNDSILNINEFISYVVIESLSEFYKSKKYIIERKGSSDDTFYTNFYKEPIQLLNSKDFTESFVNKPFGFYVCKVPSQDYCSLFYGDKYLIIGNQPKGLYCYEIYNETRKKSGFATPLLEIKNDIFRKEHSFVVELKKSNNTDISSLITDSLFKNIINETVFKCFVHWCSTSKNEITEKGYIAFSDKNSSKISQKNNYPSIINFESKKLKTYSFEELRFKGDYSFLSFLDDLFEDIIEMDYVNFFSENVNMIHKIKHKSRKLNDLDFSKKYSFDKKFFNDFDIESFERTPLEKVEAYERGSILTSLNPHYLGTKDDIEKYNFNVAKINKLRLYSFYIDFFLSFNKLNFLDEIQSIFSENICSLLENDEFLKSITTLATGSISKRNFSENFLRSGNLAIFAIPDEKLYKFNNNLIMFDFDSINFFDYKTKKKANKVIGFDIKNLEQFSFIKNFCLNLSKESEIFVKLFEAHHKLEKILKDKGENRSDLNEFFDYGKDIELYTFYYFKAFARVFVPMNKKNFDSITEHFDLINPDKIINCQFLYKNTGGMIFY